MPPRKNDPSKIATGDEGAPAKELPIREGINIEVTLSRTYIPYDPQDASHTMGLLEQIWNLPLTQLTGSQPSEEHCDEAGEGGSTTKYTDPGECYVSNDQERDCFCELSGFTVRSFPPRAQLCTAWGEIYVLTGLALQRKRIRPKRRQKDHFSPRCLQSARRTGIPRLQTEIGSRARKLVPRSLHILRFQVLMGCRIQRSANRQKKYIP